jgi:anti-sigma factor RsiW
MTCEECEEILLDSDNHASRKGWMPGVSVLNLAKQHAESCLACAARMSEISRMEAGLNDLRHSTLRVEVPAAIEASLSGEFRRRVARPGMFGLSPFGWRLLWGSAIALVVASALALYSMRASRSSMRAQAGQSEHPAQQSSVIVASSDQASIEKHHSEIGGPATVSPVTKRPKRNSLPRTGARRESLLPARSELSLNGGGNVVRVTLPVASLVAMGVPLNPEISDRRVTADVARDPFGAVIAIHLVETN